MKKLYAVLEHPLGCTFLFLLFWSTEKIGAAFGPIAFWLVVTGGFLTTVNMIWMIMASWETKRPGNITIVGGGGVFALTYGVTVFFINYLAISDELAKVWIMAGLGAGFLICVIGLIWTIYDLTIGKNKG